MKYEQRRKELIEGLKATGNENVYQQINQVAEVLGIEEAERLHTPGTLVHDTEAVRFKRAGDGSRAVDRIEQGGYAEFNREALLEALEATPETPPVMANDEKKEEPGEINKSTQGHRLAQRGQKLENPDSGANLEG